MTAWAAIRRLGVHPIYWLSHLAPRRDDLWAFGSWHGRRFRDNARYLFIYCSKLADSDVRCVWITRHREILTRLRAAGLEAYHRWSLQGIRVALRAGVYVFDYRSTGIGFPLSGGTVKVNLWHGIPLKRIERDIQDEETPMYKGHHGSTWQRVWEFWREPQTYERYDYIVAPGSESARTLQSAFGVGDDQVLIAGYPRNDSLFDDNWTRTAASAEEREIVESLERDREQGYTIIGYLPTWRDAFRFRWIRRQVPLPLRDLDRVLQDHRAKLYCKMHSVDRAELDGIDECSNVQLIPSAVDVSQFMELLDALISDYSSVYFDYLLLDRPLIFYAYDLKEYQRSSRTFYYEYDDVTPGPKAYTPEQIVSEVRRLLTDYRGVEREWREERARVRAAMHSHHDGRYSERCLTQIRLRLGREGGAPALRIQRLGV